MQVISDIGNILRVSFFYFTIISFIQSHERSICCYITFYLYSYWSIFSSNTRYENPWRQIALSFCLVLLCALSSFITWVQNRYSVKQFWRGAQLPRGQLFGKLTTRHHLFRYFVSPNKSCEVLGDFGQKQDAVFKGSDCIDSDFNALSVLLVFS